MPAPDAVGDPHRLAVFAEDVGREAVLGVVGVGDGLVDVGRRPPTAGQLGRGRPLTPHRSRA